MNRQSFEEHYDPGAFPGSLRLAAALVGAVVIGVILFEAASVAAVIA
jgi:hypothetical protein